MFAALPRNLLECSKTASRTHPAALRDYLQRRLINLSSTSTLRRSRPHARHGLSALDARYLERTAVIGNGHGFHSYELMVKRIIILSGFMVGLTAPCEGVPSLGLQRVVLIPDGVALKRPG